MLQRPFARREQACRSKCALVAPARRHADFFNDGA
jgi:hypothetical protein